MFISSHPMARQRQRCRHWSLKNEKASWECVQNFSTEIFQAKHSQVESSFCGICTIPIPPIITSKNFCDWSHMGWKRQKPYGTLVLFFFNPSILKSHLSHSTLLPNLTPCSVDTRWTEHSTQMVRKKYFLAYNASSTSSEHPTKRFWASFAVFSNKHIRANLGRFYVFNSHREGY